MNRLAIYLRLSKEDYQKKEESESISNQREYIRNYIKGQKEFKECELIEYVDDGFSGTNPNRPAYQRLLEDIRNNQVDILVVKDMSRFSRDLVLCQEIVQDKKRKFYYPARTSFSLDWLARYNFSNSLGDKYPQ